MYIYWSMLLMTLLVGCLSYMTSYQEATLDGEIINKTQYMYAFFTFLYIIFFIGLRDEVLDTYAYINSFKTMPIEWNAMIKYVNDTSTGKGFYLIQGIFKIFISDNHYVWLTFLCVVSCLCLLHILYKNSIDFPLTAYLFIATCSFTWLLNGTRQFLVVCILFAFSDWIIQGKKVRYILLALFLSTIHTSAIFIIPVCLFISTKEVFGKRMFLFVVLTLIGTYYSEIALEIVGLGLDKDYSESLSSGSGSSIIRLLVSAVPVFISIVGYKYVKLNSNPSICLAINMSVVGVCFYIASSFTNGILVGRMPIYFTVYNLYLIPWLIKKCFTKKLSRLIWFSCVVMYGIYFYYQINIAWSGLPYISNILNIT